MRDFHERSRMACPERSRRDGFVAEAAPTTVQQPVIAQDKGCIMRAYALKRFLLVPVFLFLIVSLPAPSWSEEFLNKNEKQVLLKIARATLALYLNQRVLPQLSAYPATPNLQKECGVFVTLKNKKNKELRGCIGYLSGVKPLREAVRDCTVESATRDQRFTPMQQGEDQTVTIEISVLTPPQKISSIKQIEIGKHGLIISKGLRRGLLLPQVPVEWGWNRDDFLKAICQKAGLPEDAWKEGADLYIFTAQVFREDE
jgi:AmmeMemoRadiSam system protein A